MFGVMEFYYFSWDLENKCLTLNQILKKVYILME